MKITQLLTVWTLFSTLLIAQDVVVDYDRSVDLTQYKTFDWVKREKISIVWFDGDSKAELSDRAIDEQVRHLVEEQLRKKGFQKAINDTDVLISYFAVGKLDLGAGLTKSASSLTASPHLNYDHWRPFYNVSNDYQPQKKGTLTIDMVDRATSKIVWRASASDTVSKVKDIPKKIAKAIKKMFKKFPPK